MIREHFRTVLGHLPTGVVGITSISPDGTPVGMAIGSFTSVSLDPPLVAFCPAKSSTTFPKIKAAGSFCANVLSSDQESVCRAFAAPGADKFAGVSWRPGVSGAPLLEGALAWIDCSIAEIYEAGDHYIVVGAVQDLQLATDALPLVFFQGGYGRYAPPSIGVAPEHDLVEHLRLIDAARPEMEKAAAELGVECLATVLVGNEMVIVASTGLADARRPPTRVGQRIPFEAPLGAIFAAWDDEPPGTWATRPDLKRTLDRVRSRGWSMGLSSPTHRELELALSHMRLDKPSDGERLAVQRVIDKLGSEYEPEQLAPGVGYEVRNVNVPVFGPDRRVAGLLSVYHLPAPSSVADVNRYVTALQTASAAASQSLRTSVANVVTSEI